MNDLSAPGSLRRPDGAFRNVVPRQAMGLRKTLGLVWRMFTAKPPSTVPARPIPVRPLDAATLARAPEATLFRLGHSTLLMKLDGGWWLTDPVFAERASPFSFAGPKRFHAPPLTLDALPPLRGIILSHDHYDHLDRDSILALAPRAGLIVAPLGVGERLVGWGIDAAKSASSTGGRRRRRAACAWPRCRPSIFRAAACATATARCGFPGSS